MTVIDSDCFGLFNIASVTYIVPGLYFIFVRIYLCLFFWKVFWNCKCYPVVGVSWRRFLMFPLGSNISGPTAWEVSDGIGVRAHGSPPVLFPPIGIMTPWAQTSH